MPTLDDERFEAYLKQFRPLLPEPLPAVELSRGARHTFALGHGLLPPWPLLF